MPKNTFNVDPYFDDFDETKNFHQILYKPKFPVQTREMNQQQSIVYNQLERFGDHIFKHGSIVADTIPNYDNQMNYVRLKDLDTNNNEVNTAIILDKRVVGKTTGITATCILATKITDNDPPTIFVKYLTSSEDGMDKVFQDGEELVIYDDNNNSIYSCTVRCPTCQGSTEPATETTLPTGKSAVFTVTEGIYYVFGRFVYTPDQIIILDKYDTVPNIEVGFNIIQSMITENDDLSLLDNSLGYPNYTSPGADRYKIQLNLEKIPTGSNPQDNWIMIARIEFGVLKEIKDKPEYADIIDMMARRTYDESGDYTVKPFLISFMDFLKSSAKSNDGLYYADPDTTPAEQYQQYKDQYVATMSGGKAYVRGYEIERLSDFNLVLDRARETGIIENNALRYTQGNYIYVALTDNSNTYPLYDVTESNFAVDFEDISFYTDDNIWQSENVTTAVLGTAKVKSQINTGKTIRNYADSADVPVFKLFLFDMEMGDNLFSTINAVYKAGVTTFSAKVLTDNEFTEIDAGVGNGSGLTEAKIYEPISNLMINRLSESFTSGIANVNLTTRKKFYGQTDGTGKFDFSMAPNDIAEAFDSNKWIFSQKDGTGQYIYRPINSGLVSITPDSKHIEVTGFSSNTMVCVIMDVITYNVPSKIKTLTSKAITVELTAGSYQDWFGLGVVDTENIVSVTDVTDPNLPVDVTVDWALDDGITDNTYGVSYVQRTLESQPIYNGSSKAVYEIVYEYYVHNNSNIGYFFSANSYQGMIDDPNQDFDYEDIPTYLGQNEETYDLRRCLDFRVDEDPLAVNGDFTDTTYIPSNQSNIIHDIIFYLPRVDKIVIDSKTKNFLIVKGVPSVKPIAPKTPKGTMELYTINMEPYTLDVKKDVLTKYKNNRRYTMRDIGKIEKRVDNLEYYVTFNMLESSAASASIKDANGIDRYKNGFITDNFKSFVASDTKHPEFNGAIDIQKSEMRPSFHTRKIDITLDEGNSSNYQITGNMITQPYTSFLFQSQKLASKTLSVNPYFIFNWVGDVKLVPEYDSWKDVERKPDLVVAVDSGMDDGKEFDGGELNGALFGNWETKNTDLSDEDLDDLIALANDEAFSANGTFKDVTASDVHVVDGQAVQTLSITEEKSLGDKVTEVNLIPFVRKQDVQFVVTAMRPNTVIYPFFDDVPVAEYCRPLNGANGDELKTSGQGEFIGVFSLPNSDEVSFHTGDRIFKLSDSSDNSDDTDEVTTTATTTWWSGGLKTIKQETLIETVKTVDVAVNACVWNGVSYEEGAQLETFKHDLVWPGGGTILVPTSPFSIAGGAQYGAECENGSWKKWDPIAQSFSVEVEQNGCFVTKIDVFFSAKSEDKTVWLELREMINGYPGTAILPFSHTVKQPDSVNISDDASEETTFTFESPVFLEGNTDYCFVIGSSDLAYRVHVARLGGVNSDGAMITSQPSLGSLFKSQNNKTWNAEQMEDIKFELYKANFDRQSMELNFKDSGFDIDKLGFNPIETENLSDIVRIRHKNHGFTVGDKFSMDLYTETLFDIVIKSGDLIIGQKLTTPNGSCVVAESTFVEEMTTPLGHNGNRYQITVKDITGFINSGETNLFTADQYYEEVTDTFILEKLDIDQQKIASNENNLQSCVGYFEETLDGTINGIPMSAFTDPIQPLIVLTVDSIDSYSIQVSGTPADISGFSGGVGVTVGGQVQVDMFNLSGNFKKYDCTFVNDLTGVTHAGTNSNFANYAESSKIDFNDNENELLEQPLKISSQFNIGNTPSGNSLDINLTTRAILGDTNLTPVVMKPTISFTSITNRVSWNDQAHYEVAPNFDPLWDTEFPQPDNARWVDETDPLEGVEPAKYVLKKVTLQNPATMLKIYADVFKPNDSAVDFYYKILPVEKSSGLENENWVKAVYDQEFVSSSANDFIESEVTVGDEDVGQTPLQEFKEFRIKIVLKTKNSAIPPKIKNLRAIAVT